MTDSVEVAIEGALLAAASAFAATQSLTIALPNIEFNPPNPTKTAKYLRAIFLPADTEMLGISFDDPNKHYGLFQIDVFQGLGGGEMAPARIAALVIAAFKRGTTFTRDGFTIRILDAPYRLSAVKDDPWLMLPVRIKYCCFASNPA